MAQNFDEVSQGIEAENVDIDDVGISSDEEEDLDRCMESSGSELRQVFVCFYKVAIRTGVASHYHLII